MSYKVKSFVYLICFLISVVLYAHMENTTENPENKEVQLVQTDANELPENKKNAL